jgi:hypothetical protein
MATEKDCRRSGGRRVEPLQQRYREITSEKGYVAKVLDESAARVRPIARETVEKVKKAMGLSHAQCLNWWADALVRAGPPRSRSVLRPL